MNAIERTWGSCNPWLPRSHIHACMSTPTWLSPMLVQHDNVGEVVAATGLDELVEDHASAIDALGVGEDQLHLLCARERGETISPGTGQTPAASAYIYLSNIYGMEEHN